MDVTTMMMSSMTQSPAMLAAGGATPGLPASPKGLDFSLLLGTSLQTQLALLTPMATIEGGMSAMEMKGAIEGANPSMDLKAAMALLSEITESGSETAALPATELVKGEDIKALSVMQLLNGLKLRLGDHSRGRSEIPAEGVDQLAAEIRSLFGQDGQLLPELEEKLKGRLNPAVTERESRVEELLAELASPTGDNAAVGQLAELLAAVNGLLTQTPQQLLDKKVEEGDAASDVITAPVMIPTDLNVEKGEKLETTVTSEKVYTKGNPAKLETRKMDTQPVASAEIKMMPQAPQHTLDKKVETETAAGAAQVAVQVTAPVQQNAAKAENAEPAGKSEPTDIEELSFIDSKGNPVKPESGKVVESAELEMQPKPVKQQNTVLQSHPKGLQVSESEGRQAAQEHETSKYASIEIVVKEEEPIQELPQPAVQKPETVVSAKPELFRSDTMQAVSADMKPQQVLTDRPVTSEPLKTLSSDQIAGQVRDKLAEHRFTQDNGQVTIRLHPAELGELKISVRMDNQRLHVEIVAENRTVKDALMENLGSLKEALARQNVEMKQFDVSTGSRQFFNQGFREGRQQEPQHVVPRQAGWLTGRMEATAQTGSVTWQPRKNALLDMMM